MERRLGKENPHLVRVSRVIVRGAEGGRTPVQTYSPKAFYMLIRLLFVGNRQGTGKPICSLFAIVLSCSHKTLQQQPVLVC